MKKLKAVVIGAGMRGMGYAEIMAKSPEKFEVVAVAEPQRHKRNHLKEMYNIPEEMCFESWEPLLEKGKIADFAIIATLDRMHYKPAMKAISLGYDLLLEKPISPIPQECVDIADQSKRYGTKVVVCHVLRYTHIFMKLKELIESGAVGEVMTVVHEECVENIHQSHSFVRGNWGNSERSSTMLLQKSCHDLDILQWLVGKKCKKIQSFGSLSYFKESNAPAGSPERCIEGCPVGDTCPYNAVRLYLEDKQNGWFRDTSTGTVSRDNFIPTDEDVRKTLEINQYGKCVFKCDNDVVDHQIVSMLFEDDVTVTFSMNAFNKGGRYIHIQGTKGEIRAHLAETAPITLFNLETRKTTEYDMFGRDGITSGHGGGDEGIINSLYEYFANNRVDSSITEADISAKNHMLVFAAEKSRLEGTVVDIDEFVNNL